MKNKIKCCPNCHQPIDRPMENAEEKLKLPTAKLLGQQVYTAVLNKHFNSIDLCNWCYSTMQSYRYSLSKEQKPKELKDLKTFEKAYDGRSLKQRMESFGGGVGFTYFRVYQEGFQELLDFITQQRTELLDDILGLMNKIEKECTVDGMYSPDNIAERFFNLKQQIIDYKNK